MISNHFKLENYQVVTDIKSLEGLKKTARKNQEEALEPVAQQFEALFVNQILKQSRNVQFDDGWMDHQQSDFYKSWHDSQLSQALTAKGGFGLAEKIVAALTPEHPVMTHEAYLKEIAEFKPQTSEKENEPQKLPTTEQALSHRPFKN